MFSIDEGVTMKLTHLQTLFGNFMKAPSSGSTMFVLCGTVQVYNSCTDVHWQYYHAVVVSISSSGQCLVVALISVCVNILQSYENKIQ